MAKLKEYGKIITGNTPPSSNPDYYNSNDICFVKPSDIASDMVTNITDSEYYISEDARACSRIIPAGSILVTCIGTVGKIGITQREVAFNQQINAIILNDKVDVTCLAYALLFHSDRIKAIANAPVVPIINKSTFSEIDISLPDLPTQRRIAATLDKVSEGIAVCRKMMADLDTLIKARFVEMFGDPISNPKGWNVFKLSDCLVRIDNGKSFTCDSAPRKGSYPAVLKLSAATYGDYRPDENKALLDESQFVEAAEVHAGDLLFTRKNTPELVGMAAYVFETPEHLMMPDLIFRLVPNDKMNPVYLWQLINNREFRPVIQSISGGSAKSMSNISKERLENIDVICPPITEQVKIEEVLKQVAKSKFIVQQQLADLETLKKRLMQEYFG